MALIGWLRVPIRPYLSLYPHLFFFALKMEAALSFETSENIYQTTLHHIPEITTWYPQFSYKSFISLQFRIDFYSCRNLDFSFRNKTTRTWSWGHISIYCRRLDCTEVCLHITHKLSYHKGIHTCGSCPQIRSINGIHQPSSQNSQ